MTEPRIVSGPRELVIAPPTASLASVDSPDAEPTRLPVTVVFNSLSVPQLSIPPPPANANGQGPLGQSGPMGAVSLGATRLPVMTLFAMVTLAPPLKSALGGISTPPPAATTPSWPVNGSDSGLDRVMPSVIVTPSMETVGSDEAPYSPIVTTGPPPLMTVLLAPAPTSLTLTSTVNPPSYVPGPILIVSPLWAAASAGASCVYAQPLGQTVRVAAEAGPAPSASNAAVAGTNSMRRGRSLESICGSFLHSHSRYRLCAC